MNTRVIYSIYNITREICLKVNYYVYSVIQFFDLLYTKRTFLTIILSKHDVIISIYAAKLCYDKHICRFYMELGGEILVPSEHNLVGFSGPTLIFLSDWSNKNESQGHCLSISKDVMSPSNQNEVYNFGRI